MASHNDKRRQLDDEMSRFEAEISGPPGVGVGPLPPPPPPPRPVIGSSTFSQVQQRLQQAHPEPPGTGGPPGPGLGGMLGGPRPSMSSSSNGVGPLPPPPPPPGGYIGPQPPPGSQQQNRLPPPPPPGFIPPQLSRHHMPHNVMNDGPGMGPGPMMGGGPGFVRPPGPPRHPGPPGYGPPDHGPPGHDHDPRGPNVPNSGPPGMGPHGPPGHHPHGPHSGPHSGPPRGPPGPGFGPMGPNQMHPNHPGPHMGGPGMVHGGGPMRGAHPPPPPPPSMLQSQQQSSHTISAPPFTPAVITKSPTVISSAPKLYTPQGSKGESKAGEEGSKTSTTTPATITAAPATTITTTPAAEATSEPKKKRAKTEPTSNPTPTAASIKTQAQEMAEKVRASTVTMVSRPESGGVAPAPGEEKKKEGGGKQRSKRNLRCAGGQIWEDHSLNEWENDDFRIFCGDLGNDVTDELLTRYFSHLPSFVRAKVVRDKRTNKSKGYGFISFSDPQDYIRAMKEMNGKYVGSRPIKLRKSTWKDRNVDMVQKKQREKQLLGLK